MTGRLLIIRGLPGSGKTTLVELFVPLVFSADDYFYRNGQYVFDAEKLAEAHGACFDNVTAALLQGKEVAVANTFSRVWEFQRYIDFCNKTGIAFTVITVETTFTDEELAARNIHGVSVEVIERMRQRWENYT